MAKVHSTTTEQPLAKEQANSFNNDDEEEEPPEEWDTVVIGSGLGGLSVASILAQLGSGNATTGSKQRVLVLDQHPEHLGGSCHSFDEKGYPFAAGIHYVGAMGDGQDEKKYMDALTVPQDPIEWVRYPDNYESIWIGGGPEDEKNPLRRYDMVSGRQKEALMEQFPNDKEAIVTFFEECHKAARAGQQAFIFKALPRALIRFLIYTGLHRWLDRGFSKYSNMTVRQVMDSLTTNLDLRTVLESLSGDYGVLPTEAPFFLHALIMLHFAGGAYYPLGGPEQIVLPIARTISHAGGEIRINTRVKEIWIENGRAAGVRLGNGLRIRAQQVISDAGVYTTFRQLVPSLYWPPALRGAQPNTPLDGHRSCICLFVGLEGDTQRDYSLPKNVVHAFPTTDIARTTKSLPKTLQGFLDIPAEELEIFISSPTAVDTSTKETCPNKTSLQIIAEAPPYEAFALLEDPKTHKAAYDHKKEYQDFKDAFGQKLWTRARQVLIAAGASQKLPENLSDAAVAEVGTPLTLTRYLGKEEGEFLGLEHNIARFQPETFYLELRPDVPTLPGLYFTGQDVATCGMVGAMMGGYLCAGKILGDPNPDSLCQRIMATQRS